MFVFDDLAELDDRGDAGAAARSAVRHADARAARAPSRRSATSSSATCRSAPPKSCSRTSKRAARCAWPKSKPRRRKSWRIVRKMADSGEISAGGQGRGSSSERDPREPVALELRRALAAQADAAGLPSPPSVRGPAGAGTGRACRRVPARPCRRPRRGPGREPRMVAQIEGILDSFTRPLARAGRRSRRGIDRPGRAHRRQPARPRLQRRSGPAGRPACTRRSTRSAAGNRDVELRLHPDDFGVLAAAPGRARRRAPVRRRRARRAAICACMAKACASTARSPRACSRCSIIDRRASATTAAMPDDDARASPPPTGSRRAACAWPGGCAPNPHAHRSGSRAKACLRRVVGLTLEASGCSAPLGSRCRVEHGGRRWVDAEVVGFAGDRTLSDADRRPRAACCPTRASCARASAAKSPVGDGLLGRVIDGDGVPLDGLGPLRVGRTCASLDAARRSMR